MEENVFRCPWTLREIRRAGAYDLDHLMPLAVCLCNELWNLVPAGAQFNQHVKRDRLPSADRLAAARPALERTYRLYAGSAAWRLQARRLLQ